MKKHSVIPFSDVKKVELWKNCGRIDTQLMLFDNLSEVNVPSTPIRMTFIVLGLCTKGEAHYMLDAQPQTVRPGDAFVVAERHVISDFHASADLDGVCFCVSVNFFREVIQNTSDLSAIFLYARNFPVLHQEEKDIEKFKKYFNAIKQHINEDTNHFRKELVRTLLLAMFYDLSNVVYHVREDKGKKYSRADVIFNKFIHMIGDHCKRERRVSWYAEQLCITPKYLSECVKAVSRRTPNEWIESYVTLEVSVMLKNTTKTIKEITEEMNFPNQSFLGKYFKEHVGMSPSEYRRK